MQAKRIDVNESNNGAGGNTAAALLVPTDPREEVNFHNIWGSVTVEPQDANANAQGTWVLYILTKNVQDASFVDVNIDNQEYNQYIIACGVWGASNEHPYNSGPIHPSTSRTLGPGDQLRLQSVVTGITAGLASNRVMLCAHTTRK